VALGGRIRQRRSERGWSANHLAQRAGVSSSYLSKLERDVAPRPSGEVLGRLAAALGTTIADLVGAEEGAPPPEVPPTLRAFADRVGLPEADVRMLARIAYRGEQPKTPEAWGFLYEALKRAVRE
jgi:transcriptional regulator with XRE-family HTH domain